MDDIQPKDERRQNMSRTVHAISLGDTKQRILQQIIVRTKLKAPLPRSVLRREILGTAVPVGRFVLAFEDSCNAADIYTYGLFHHDVTVMGVFLSKTRPFAEQLRILTLVSSLSLSSSERRAQL
jgi:hypothetical protein